MTKTSRPRNIDYESHLFLEPPHNLPNSPSDKEVDELLEVVELNNDKKAFAKRAISECVVWIEASGVFNLKPATTKQKKAYKPILTSAKNLQKLIQTSHQKPELSAPFGKNFCESLAAQETLKAINHLIEHCNGVITGAEKICGLGQVVFTSLMLYEFITGNKSTVDHSAPNNAPHTKSELFALQLCKISAGYAKQEAVMRLDFALQEQGMPPTKHQEETRKILTQTINSAKVKGFCARYPEYADSISNN